MRYIYLNPIKSTEDKNRVKNHPKMSKQQLSKLINDKNETKVITDSTKKSSAVQHANFQKMVFEDVSNFLTSKKHFLSNLITKDLKPSQSTPVFKDGKDTFLLNSLESQATDLFIIKQIRENKANDITLYNNLISEISKNISTSPKNIKDQFLKLPLHHTLKTINKKDLIELVNLGLHIIWPEKKPKPYDPINPGPEKGEGQKTDQTMSTSCLNSNPQPNVKGLLANINWPLKPHLTSVKNQANRGTCSSFGTVAAIESRISVRYGQKVNLCEQDLYKMQKLDWNPNIFDDYYDDGYSPPFSALFQLASGYKFPFESAWPYNPSNSRNSNDATRKHTRSCDNYSGDCSNTNHQADKNCYTMDVTETNNVVTEVCDWVEGIPIIGGIFGWTCHTVTKAITEIVDQVEVCVYDTNINGNSRFKLSDYALIWDPFFQNDITLAKLCLNQRKPIIFCFTVPDSFNSANHNPSDGKGFVIYDKSESTPSDAGGHCITIVGFIDNKMIPTSLKIADGDGGGYFIVKNSWGKCFGDVGYAYLPYSWVDKWGTAMVAINNVQRV